MRTKFPDDLRSRWHWEALNYMFENPIFREKPVHPGCRDPEMTANGFTNKLAEAGILRTLIPPAGRAPCLYGFPSLLNIVRDPD